MPHRVQGCVCTLYSSGTGHVGRGSGGGSCMVAAHAASPGARGAASMAEPPHAAAAAACHARRRPGQAHTGGGCGSLGPCGAARGAWGQEVAGVQPRTGPPRPSGQQAGLELLHRPQLPDSSHATPLHPPRYGLLDAAHLGWSHPAGGEATPCPGDSPMHPHTPRPQGAGACRAARFALVLSAWYASGWGVRAGWVASVGSSLTCSCGSSM